MQTIQLGLSGKEVTLPTESRTFDNFDNMEISSNGRSANGRLATNFITSKELFTISYGVITEANKTILTDIFKLQITNGSFLSFKYTVQDGSTVSKTVKMNAPSFGAVVVKDIYYYNGVKIHLEEV